MTRAFGRAALVLAVAAAGLAGQDSAPASRAAASRASDTRPTEALAIEEALRARLAGPMPTLDLDLAMFGEDFFGAKPENVRFSDDGRTIVFTWRRFGETRRGTFVYDLAAGSLVRLDDGAPGPRFGVLDAARGRRLVVKGRALVLESCGAEPARRELARFPANPSEPRFDAAETAALCRVGDALWRVPFEGGGAGVLCEWADGPAEERRGRPDAAPDSRATRLKDLLAEREIAWFRSLFERRERRKAESAPSRRSDDVEVKRYAAPAGARIVEVDPSPRGDFVAFRLRRQPATPPRNDRVAAFVTESGYLEVEDARAKAGDAAGTSWCVLFDVATGAAKDLVLPSEPPRLRVDDVTWSADGAWCVATATSFDRSHRLLLRVDPASGATTVLRHDVDPAWSLGSRVGFCGRTSRFALLSEASGFRNLHVIDVATGATLAVAPGPFEVDDVFLAADGASAVATARLDGPHAEELVRLDLVTGGLERLTRDGGLRELVVSPDGATFAEVRSKPDQPWELFVRRAAAPTEAVRVTDSPSPAFKSYRAWRTPPIVAVEAEGGTFPARLFAPDDGSRGGPGVVFIHGAGYLQNVHDGWSQYAREYAFHHVLAARGYTVLDVDYRGSAGYGRDFRAAVKGRVGDLDAADVVAAARRLVAVEGCDPRRIHCYGGSYGGFLTLMALFRHPGVFRSGAALRPVTDWSHYHEGYTANLLDDPLDDADAYRRASPITWASGLADRLLLCHGLMDDNVLAQDTLRLVQRLIELRKTNFDVMLYPLERHGFVDAAAWSDEYRRIFELFERP